MTQFILPESPAEYAALYEKCQIVDDDERRLKIIATRILRNKPRYDTVSVATGLPFALLGSIHMRECSLNFNCHFQNGDPLRDNQGNHLKTIHVPSGLGPFDTWEESALADLRKRDLPDKWSIGLSLMFAEAFNGKGYHHRGVPTPYVWAGTDIYKGGLFAADHHYNPLVWDHRPGVAAILKTLDQECE